MPRRDKVSGIGEELGQLLGKSNLTLEEISKESNISIRKIQQFINNKKEPYVIPEMTNLICAIKNENNKDEILDFINKWFKKVGETND